jgi:hypothetical protein
MIRRPRCLFRLDKASGSCMTNDRDSCLDYSTIKGLVTSEYLMTMILNLCVFSRISMWFAKFSKLVLLTYGSYINTYNILYFDDNN